jgi:hypothetical protein
MRDVTRAAAYEFRELALCLNAACLSGCRYPRADCLPFL